MSSRYQHLIWDFDGTLFDTYPIMAKALQQTLQGFGKQIDAVEAQCLIKQTLYHGVTTYALRFGLPVDSLMSSFRRIHALQAQLLPMPGMLECLQATANMGCRHYLFTHRDHVAIDQLTLHHAAIYFTDYVTREDGFADKPSPQALQHLMQKHGFAAKGALMIGDRDIDIGSAHAAGMDGMLLDPEGSYPALQVAWRVIALAEIPLLLQTAPQQ